MKIDTFFQFHCQHLIIKRERYLEFAPLMKIIAIIAVIITCIASGTKADLLNTIECHTDKKEYVQGDDIHIYVRNNSRDDFRVVNRNFIDGSFATIEIRENDDKWQAIELVAAATVTTFTTLKHGESHLYIWKTKGYNRGDTLAIPGEYRIILNTGIQTNEFIIKAKSTE